MLRVHGNWLVNPLRVLELEREAGETTLLVGCTEDGRTVGVRVPVAKDRAAAVRDALPSVAPGVRHST